MATLKDFLLANTTLPVTGTYTFREHFESFISSVTANLGGELLIKTTSTPVSIATKTTKINIKVTDNELSVGKTPVQTVVDNTKQVNIVIDPSS